MANMSSAMEHMSSKTNQRVFDHILVWGTRLVTFLVPLFFLATTFEPFEFNKQLVLLALTSILFALWVVRVVTGRGTTWLKSPLNYLVLAWFVVYVVSTVISVDPITSILGFYGRFNGGLASILSYVLYYLLVRESVKDDQSFKWLLSAWISALGLGALILGLQLLGVRLFGGLDFAQGASFSPLGRSLNAVVLALTSMAPLALFLSRQSKSMVVRTLSLIAYLVVLAIVFMVDYQLGWVGLIVGSVVWLGLIFWRNEAVGFKWTILPSLALILALVAWPLVTTQFTGLQVPAEVNLSMKASFEIAAQNAKASPILGSGPETFIYGFSKFRPENFNDSDFWAYRFDKAASELAQTLGTVGWLGLAVYVALLLFGLYLAWRVLKQSSHEHWYLAGAVVASYVVLVVGNVFYFTNTILALALWLNLGLLTVLAAKNSRQISLQHSPRASFLFSFGLAIVVLLAIVICFGVGRVFMADVAYAKAQSLATRLNTLDQAQASFAKAVSLNPYRDTYRIGLAQVYLAMANREANKPAPKDETARKAQVDLLQQQIRFSIDAANSATNLAPESVANWEALGSIYRGTALFARDAEEWVIKSFSKAISLEDKNPALHTELGKAYLVSASRRKASLGEAEAAVKTKLQTEITDLTAKALEKFDQAIKLKANYTPAHFNQALAYEVQDKFDEAIKKLESMKVFNPRDIDVLFELGSLYFNKADYSKAEVAFKNIVSLVPNHAQAHYRLSLVYQKLNDKVKAIQQLEKVLELQPTNQDIKKELDSLRAAVNEPAPAAGDTAPKK